MTKFIGWFRSFFDEDDGASTTRALTWIWTLTLCGILWLLVIARVYYALKFKDVTLLGFPSIDTGILGLTGAYLTAKVIQRGWGEKPTGTTPPEIKPPDSGSLAP